MKKYFVVSLMKNGILGGGMVADDEAITYHTGKVTVPNEYRRLEMKYQDIGEATTSWHCLSRCTAAQNTGLPCFSAPSG